MSFGELLSGTPSFLTLSKIADSTIWEEWGKSCLKSCNCPWLCQKGALELSKWNLGSWEGHVFHGPSSFKHGSVSDTMPGKHKVGRILLYVTMQLARNWIDMAFHSVDFFCMWPLCLLLLFCKNGAPFIEQTVQEDFEIFWTTKLLQYTPAGTDS